MHLTEFPVVLVLLATGLCRANIVLRSSITTATTHELDNCLVDIVTSCYGDRIEGIVLAGDFSDTVIRTLAVQHVIPVALIEDTDKFEHNKTIVPERFRHKLHVFIVNGSSRHQLHRLITNHTKPSIWWDQLASFFILDSTKGCVNGHDYLNQAVKHHMLNAKVICYHNNGGIIILNHNPYESQAPIPWQHFNGFRGTNKYDLDVFSRVYRRNETMCVNLDFEKTRNLAGHTIRIHGIEKISERTASHRARYQSLTRSVRVLDGFRDVLNATLKYCNLRSCNFKPSERLATGVKLMLSTLEGHNFTITYPHIQVDMVLVSQFRGHKSQLNKIASVIDGSSRIGVIIVCLITLIFFKFFVSKSLVPAFLNLIGIICNRRITNLSGNTPSRIYLPCLLFFVITMHGIYQGNLAFALTTNIPLPNLNTFQDFVDLGYKKVCVHDVNETLIDHPIVRKHMIRSKNVTYCITKVAHDSSTAYFGYMEGHGIDKIRESKLHVSREPIKSLYAGFVMKRDWHLEERVNKIIQRFVEADMLDRWDAKCDPIKLTDFEFDETVKDNQVFKKIELGELTFAFTILSIGLACATVAFIIEFLIKYKPVCICEVSIVRRRWAR